MSRIAKKPVTVPSGVTVTIAGQTITTKGSNGQLSQVIHPSVVVEQGDAELTFAPRDGSKQAMALAGTTRALVGNMVVGVSEGFKKELTLVGVGYRAALQGNNLNLSLGFSHPIEYALPEGITAEVPAATQVVIKGADKQVVGQVAAEIRGYRPPEPYKGKGVRYASEHVRRKEAKKK